MCLFIYFYVSKYFACMYISAYMDAVPRESTGLPRTGLTGGQEALWGVLVPELLGEQPVFFTTEPSLRPH